MTAGVSSMSWSLGGRKEDGEAKLDLVTRDLLGGGGGGGTVAVSAVEAELQPASTFWSLCAKSCSSPAKRQLLDLNLPPTSVVPPNSAGLAAPTVPAALSAVCTLEKVKLALERESRSKRQRCAEATPSLSSSTTTSSAKRRAVVEDGIESSSTGSGGGEMMAGACKRCFMLVLVPKSEPRCPRCDSPVPVPVPVPVPALKTALIDLNSKQD